MQMRGVKRRTEDGIGGDIMGEGKREERIFFRTGGCKWMRK